MTTRYYVRYIFARLNTRRISMTNYVAFWTLNFYVSHKSTYRSPLLSSYRLSEFAFMLFVANINVTQYCKSMYTLWALGFYIKAISTRLVIVKILQYLFTIIVTTTNRTILSNTWNISLTYYVNYLPREMYRSDMCDDRFLREVF